MKLLFIIDNLQFFRDVLRSPVLSKLLSREEVEVVICTTFAEDAIQREFGHARLRARTIRAQAPPLPSTLLYSLAKDVYTVEQPDSSFTQKRLTEAQASGRLGLNTRLFFARCLLAMGLRSRVFTDWAAKFGGDGEFQRIVECECPSLVIYSTMLPGVGEWLKAARQQGVPLALSVASWDNPTSKGPMTVSPDHALVWTPYMKGEMQKFHGTAPERMSDVGVIYFETYFAREKLMDRTAFCASLGIKPECKILHYATGDSTLIRCNQEFIRVLQRLIVGGQLGVPCHLLVRVSPKDVFSLYKEFENLPHVTVQYPKGEGTLYGGHKWLPSADEDYERASTVKNSDVILSVSSSMVLDACCFDVPVINLAYDAGLKAPPWESVERFFAYAHCQPVLEQHATWLVKDDAALLDALKTVLSNPAAKRTERKRLLDLLVGYADGRTSERWVERVLELAKEESAGNPAPADAEAGIYK
ncbi:MAG: hypothetical protein AB1705_18330 [Verrucomicrobiota bacterium]